MAVIVKYIVVRNGVEKMTFATKKEADTHDKMLDIADTLYEFLEKEDIGLDEAKMEDVSLAFARDRDKIISILRGVKPVKPSSDLKGVKHVKSKAVLKKLGPEVTESKVAATGLKGSNTKASPKRKTASSRKVS